MNGSATFSPCGRYRYRLERDWRGGKAMPFGLLNPSTADAAKDDPTIRRCAKFAERDGFGRLVVVNLFAFRSTDPDALLEQEDPVGPENDAHIGRALIESSKVVLAWGANPIAEDRGKMVALRICGVVPTFALGFTASGAPRHPLYVRGDAPLVRLYNTIGPILRGHPE